MREILYGQCRICVNGQCRKILYGQCRIRAVYIRVLGLETLHVFYVSHPECLHLD